MLYRPLNDNHVRLVGWLGRDPVVYDKCAKFSLCVERRQRNPRSKEWETVLEWFDVVAVTAALAACRAGAFRKGYCVRVEGSLRARRYKCEDGEWRMLTSILCFRRPELLTWQPKPFVKGEKPDVPTQEEPPEMVEVDESDVPW